MRKKLVFLTGFATSILLIAQIFWPAQTRTQHALIGQPVPEFTHHQASQWLNSAPLKLDQLRGHVVLIDFWTYECWNCFRSFPWLNALQAQFATRGLKIIGVHSPEFERERDVDRIKEKIAEFALDHPVMVDNDFSYWKALQNRYWPAFYLIDKQGRLRHVYAGETHPGDSQARKIATAIARLAKEPYEAAPSL